MVTRAEDRELTLVDGTALSADGAAPAEHVGEGAEVRAPRQRELRAGREGDVGVGDRRVRDARTLRSGDVTGDESDEGATVVAGEQAQRVLRDGLIAWRGHLQRRRQVHPQLHDLE